MKTVIASLIAVASLFTAHTASANPKVDARTFVGHWTGTNFEGSQACEVEITLQQDFVMDVTVRVGNEELSFPTTTVDAVNQAIAAGHVGQFNVEGPRYDAPWSIGSYYWHFRGGLFNDGRINYLEVVYGYSQGLYQGGQRNLGCSRLTKI